MTKLELVNVILEVNEEKGIVVRSQRYEDAAKLREKENKMINEYEKEYGSITTTYKELIIFLKAELRDIRIDEILNDEN